MSSIILAKLNPAINGVNRYISSSAAPRQPWGWYQGNPRRGPRAIAIIGEAELVTRARALTGPLINQLPHHGTVASFDEFIRAVQQLFQSPQILLGSAEVLQATVERQRPLLQKLYAAGRPLEFTLLGYPNKMPNPLYTRSTGADLGEIVSLLKLAAIASRIREFYPPGARIRVLTENTIFFGMSGLTDREQHQYYLDIARWVSLLGLSNEVIVEDIVAHHTAELERSWRQVTGEYREQYAQGKPEIVDMIQAVLPTNFMTLNYRAYGEELLVRLFDPSIEERSMEELRSVLYARAVEESFGYLAYHQARYRLGFMDSAFPDSLRLTVAPKVGSFGVQMLNQSARMLPYYGYVVASGTSFEFEYLIDVPESARAVYVESRLEYPMFFEAEG